MYSLRKIIYVEKTHLEKDLQPLFGFLGILGVKVLMKG